MSGPSTYVLDDRADLARRDEDDMAFKEKQ